MMERKEFCTGCFCFICICFLLFIVPLASASTFLYTWDNGDFQGWTQEPVFGGSLYVDTTFGNSGGSLAAKDTEAGGVLLARAPDLLNGDLSVFAGIQWDEYVPSNGKFEGGTYIILRSTDGTMYESERYFNHRESWHTRFQPFGDPDAWSLNSESGNMTFLDVVANVEALFLSMDTTLEAEGAVESWVDNVTLQVLPVPVPASVFLLSGGLAAFIGTSKRKND